MKKIAFVLKDLFVGGIQRSFINLIKELNDVDYDIDLYLYEKNGDFIKDIPNNISTIFIKKRNILKNIIFFNLMKKYSKSQLKDIEYDYVIDYTGYQVDGSLDTLLSKSKNKVLWIHSNVLLKHKNEFKYKILYFFQKSKYKAYDKYVCVSEGIVKPFETLNKINISDRCTIIPNYIEVNRIFDNVKENTDFKVDEKVYNFVTVGRLVKSKGYDILLEKINELKELRKDFHLYMIGDGVEKDKLKSLIDKYSISNYVTMLGNQSNPFKYMNQMDGFVLISRYEGQGMVLMEAKTLGLELFITKNLEQYNEGINGYEDIVDAMNKAKKKNKKYDDLKDYNKNISDKLKELFK